MNLYGILRQVWFHIIGRMFFAEELRWLMVQSLQLLKSLSLAAKCRWYLRPHFLSANCSNILKRVPDLCQVHFPFSSKRFNVVSMMFLWCFNEYCVNLEAFFGNTSVISQLEHLSSWNPSWNPISQVDLEASPGKARLKWLSNVVRCQLNKSTAFKRATCKLKSFDSETGLAKTGSWRGPYAKHQIWAAVSIQNLDFWNVSLVNPSDFSSLLPLDLLTLG